MVDDNPDPYNLQRFVDAQNPIYDDVVTELQDGLKRTHWIWFIFPQLRILARSTMATHYGITSIPEARAYLQHPVLGPRLHECTQLVNQIEDRSAEEIFGPIDDVKLQASMTLFAHASITNYTDGVPENQDFLNLLDKYYAGQQDPASIGAQL